MKFRVQTSEVHHSHFEIEADSKEKAIELVEKSLMNDVPGVVDLEYTEYSYTMDADQWSAEPVH